MKKIHYIALALAVFVLLCRWSVPVAEFYAKVCYPAISAGLSYLASAFPFSLEELAVLAFPAMLLYVLVRTLAAKKRLGWWLGKTALVLVWLFVWLYMGWGNNYFRAPLLQRIGIQRQFFSEDRFNQFLYAYTDSLNGSFSKDALPDKSSIEADIKTYYIRELPTYGYASLREWQHPKRPLLNRLYSAVGVSGFMGPFFCETQVNRDVLDYEYPFTLAHELAHLAGVTSEAEANYWAYRFCTQSASPAIRYSGYYSLLPHVAANVRTFMAEEYYAYWMRTVDAQIRADYVAQREHWDALRVDWIDRVQTFLMDKSLKHNGVSSGAKEYNEVVSLIITLQANGM